MPTFPQVRAQQAFAAYTSAWVALAGGQDARALQAAFGLPNALLGYGVLSGTTALALAANATTTQVRTCFVLLPVAGGGNAFAGAVYGLDAAATITTPYYLAAPAGPAAASPGSTTPTSTNPTIVPDAVAQEWLAKWQALAAALAGLTQARFASGESGALRGINYPAVVFSGLLEPLESGDADIAELRVYYVLHPNEAPDLGVLVAIGSATAQPLPARLTVMYHNQGEPVPPGSTA